MRQRGFTVWFTGLPSSGKSTLARLLHQTLDEIGIASEIIDGEEIRQRLTKGLGFSKEDREENIRRIAYVSKLITRVGGVAIVAAISPYEELRERARIEIGDFVEVYVQCPLQICIQRDVKGLYAKAVKGEIGNFTGISDPFESPSNPEIAVRTDLELPQDNIKTILQYLDDSNYVSHDLLQRLIETRITQWSI